MPQARAATRRSSSASDASSPGSGQRSVAMATRLIVAPAASSRALKIGAGRSAAWAMSAASRWPQPLLTRAAHSVASRLLHVPGSPATTHSAPCGARASASHWTSAAAISSAGSAYTCCERPFAPFSPLIEIHRFDSVSGSAPAFISGRCSLTSAGAFGCNLFVTCELRFLRDMILPFGWHSG